MIFAGLQCTVFGSVKTSIEFQMMLTKNSAGYPKWYDYGKDYDNSVIEFTLVADDQKELEKIVREQYQGTQIDITFEEGEWLYNYTGGFVVTKSKIGARLDQSFDSYSLDISIVPVAPIEYNTLAGDRTQCTGAGYMTYAGVTVPQPRDFNFNYNTHKYSGKTHGSAYSSELQTIEYDTTAFSVDALAGTTRALIDALYTSRGNAVQVTFPEYTFPFGLARGSGEKVGELCMASTNIVEIETSNSFDHTVKLGLIELSAGAPPAETVYYFGAGTALHPFTESDWIQVDGAGGFTYEPNTLTASAPAGFIGSATVVRGTNIKTAYSRVSAHTPSGGVRAHGCIYSDSQNQAYVYGDDTTQSTLMVFRKNGVNNNITITAGIDLHSAWSCTLDFTDTEILYTVVLGTNIYTGSVPISALNTSLSWGCNATAYYDIVSYDEFYIEGDGFPYSKEVPII